MGKGSAGPSPLSVFVAALSGAVEDPGPLPLTFPSAAASAGETESELRVIGVVSRGC